MLRIILKNLLRRKTRTLLTVLGISIGAAVIIGLGTMAEGFQAGYNNMMTGSKADFVLSQPDSYDISMSSVKEEIGEELNSLPEVLAVSSMTEGIVTTEDSPYFFIFGYPSDSFILNKFIIKEGIELYSNKAVSSKGKPVILGSQAAESMHKKVGDTIRLTQNVYRIVGIYETGDAFEDSGAVLRLEDSQALLSKARQVSLFYIQIKKPEMKTSFKAKIEKRYPDLLLAGTKEFANKQGMVDSMKGSIWAVSALAILIGGVGMMNSQLMAVFERTREIGVLRAIGWSSRRVMMMILGESVIVSLSGGVIGCVLGVIFLMSFSSILQAWGGSIGNVKPALVAQAFSIVLILGLVGGVYPAWKASRLQPVEAIRYEGGGSAGKKKRFPIGGMAVQSLWQRSTRTALTLGGIALTVGAIFSLDGITQGMVSSMTSMFLTDSEIMIRQAGIADTSYSTIDERSGARIAALPEVKAITGLLFTAVVLPGKGFFVIQGYAPNSQGIQRFNVVEGRKIQANREIMIGRMISDSLHKDIGQSLELGNSRFKVVGIYESSVGWEEMGGVMTLRDAQNFTGKPRKVTMYSVKLADPATAKATVDKINTQLPDVHAALSGQFTNEMPDMQNSTAMVNGISFVAILLGGLGMMNTMLMAVLERTREIGVLRSLGWRRRAVLGQIIKESLLLGGLGGIAGILFGFFLGWMLVLEPSMGSALASKYNLMMFVRVMLVALLLGGIGGLYPAIRASQQPPVEALRYE
ncbi:MAG: FtsX-like permease family protein [Leptolinea sp.]|jgi:ABC-type antimicrobial peptide transport system permease subunit|nr:FtsX-like permease family protein [Leptolinea sp.]